MNIEDIKKYKDNILKDFGLYISILFSILYLIIFKHWIGDFDIINKRIWIIGISLAIIALSATFCYQAQNFLKSIDSENKFYNKLLEEGILYEILFLYEWNVYSGIFNIISLVAYNILLISSLFDNSILGMLAVIPIFSTIYLLSEFVNHQLTGMGLTKYESKYKEIHLKSK